MYLKDPQTNEFGQSERPSVVTWPTMALYPLGKIVGWLCGLRIGISWLTVGNFFALITIPVTLCLYCWKIMPFITRRYMLTDMRVVIQNGWSAVTGASIRYDQFDRIVSVVYPGQKFYRSADLFFYQGDRIVFVLESVRFPDVFVDQTMRARKCYLAFRATRKKAA
ncbi:MAG: hypothetical protein PHE53_03855 [Thermoguttaceae bacterium]|nr:hypothetical protein [Thermoguttaceae bacterium]